MWKVIQELLPLLIIILIVTQYVIPVIFNMQTWWLFKSKRNKSSSKISSLNDEIIETKIKVKETKEKVEIITNKVSDNLKTAEDLKKEADKLK